MHLDVLWPEWMLSGDYLDETEKDGEDDKSIQPEDWEYIKVIKRKSWASPWMDHTELC